MVENLSQITNGYRKTTHLVENSLITRAARFSKCNLQEKTRLYGDYMKDVNIVALNSFFFNVFIGVSLLYNVLVVSSI